MDCEIRVFFFFFFYWLLERLKTTLIGLFWEAGGKTNWPNIAETAVILFVELEDKMFAAVCVPIQMH